jgi:peroxiredoxin Q/BCP
MPAVVILDRRPSPPEVAYVHKGGSTFDRPSIDDLLGELDGLRSDAADAGGADSRAEQ